MPVSIDYPPLHVQTSASRELSTLGIYRLVKGAASLGLSALGIADPMTLSSACRFESEALKAGIKPIIGSEVTVESEKTGTGESKEHRLVLICRSEEGYRNLCRILSSATNKEGMPPRRVHLEALLQSSAGLTCVCSPPEIDDDEDKTSARNAILDRLKEAFNASLYLELLPESNAEAKRANGIQAQIGKRLNIPLVAGGKITCLEPEDGSALRVLQAVRMYRMVSDVPEIDKCSTGITLSDCGRMEELFAEYPEALTNTRLIADSCTLRLQGLYQRAGISRDSDVAERFGQLVRSGLKNRREALRATDPEFQSRQEAYEQRLEEEIADIREKGGSGHLLKVAEFAVEIRRGGVPVQEAGGPATGSLMAYSLGLSDINPIACGLDYRDMRKGVNTGFSSIELWVPRHMESRLVEELIDKGEAAHPTHGFFIRHKMLVGAVGRALNVSKETADRIKKLLPNLPSLAEAVEQEPRIGSLRSDDEEADELLSIAERLDGMAPHGRITDENTVLILEEGAQDLRPLWHDAHGRPVMDCERFDARYLGIPTIFINGLEQMEEIASCAKPLSEGGTFDTGKIPLDDQQTFEFIQGGDTGDIPWLRNERVRKNINELQPRDIEGVARAIARGMSAQLSRSDSNVEFAPGQKASYMAIALLVYRNAYCSQERID